MGRIIRFLAASGRFIITAFTTAVIEEEVSDEAPAEVADAETASEENTDEA